MRFMIHVHDLRNMNDTIYVIGHKSPDLDSIVAAISYANLKNKLENTDRYKPAVAGEINKVTEFVLDKYDFEKPEQLEDAKNKAIILVDHNEKSQRLPENEHTMIIEILDHHKLDFSYPNPIPVLIKAWGSSNSIIYQEYKNHNIEVNEKLAGLMLSAILDDTVITKSPTCTAEDKKIIKELSKIAGVEDWQKYGMEMFKVKSSVSEMSAEEIIKLDFKDFEFKQGKIGIGQLETVDLGEFAPRVDEILAEMKKIKESGNYHSIVLLITDIIKEGSQVLVITSDQENMEKALEHKLVDGQVYIEGLLSRKKQLTPNLTEVFDK